MLARMQFTRRSGLVEHGCKYLWHDDRGIVDKDMDWSSGLVVPLNFAASVWLSGH